MPTTKPDRLEELTAIAAALNDLRERAEKIDAGMLAFLIAQPRHSTDWLESP
jgi:hypothetical protein